MRTIHNRTQTARTYTRDYDEDTGRYHYRHHRGEENEPIGAFALTLQPGEKQAVDSWRETYHGCAMRTGRFSCQYRLSR